jgi:hypothetical protein
LFARDLDGRGWGISMTREVLQPEQQGHIDGMCAVYSVLNGCKFMFDHAETTDSALFKALCHGTPQLFLEMVYDGVEIEGLEALLGAAQEWVKQRHKRALVCERPALGKHFTNSAEFFDLMRLELQRKSELPCVAIIGLDKPWDHWTVLTRVTAQRAFFFDSWGFPKRLDFDYFTTDKDQAGDGPGEKTLLDWRSTALLRVEKL